MWSIGSRQFLPSLAETSNHVIKIQGPGFKESHKLKVLLVGVPEKGDFNLFKCLYYQAIECSWFQLFAHTTEPAFVIASNVSSYDRRIQLPVHSESLLV